MNIRTMNMRDMNVVVLSGGLDSTVCTALAAAEGPVLALTFDYGQRHRVELERARQVARHFGAEQLVVRLDASQWGGSALTDAAIDVPDHDAGGDDQIPVTYVPGRNLIFLSVAMAVAEARMPGRCTSGSTPSTTAATRTAGPSSSARSNRRRRWP